LLEKVFLSISSPWVHTSNEGIAVIVPSDAAALVVELRLTPSSFIHNISTIFFELFDSIHCRGTNM